MWVALDKARKRENKHKINPLSYGEGVYCEANTAPP